MKSGLTVKLGVAAHTGKKPPANQHPVQRMKSCLMARPASFILLPPFQAQQNSRLKDQSQKDLGHDEKDDR